MAVFYPNGGTLWLASSVKTLLANCKLRLFQSSLSVSILTQRAALLAAEADYSGYSAKTIAAWLDAIFNPSGGASIQAPTQQFAITTADPLVTNTLGGFWIETAGGDLVAIGTFPEPIAFTTVGQGLPLDVLLRFGTGL